jgi:hypothetical protein
LGGDQGNITTPTLRAITNLIAGDEGEDAIAQELIDQEMLPAIKILLERAGYSTRLECLLVLSNVAAGSISQVQNLIDENLVVELLSIIGNTSEPARLRREACWGLANMTSHRVAQQIDEIACEGRTVHLLIEFIC